MKAANRGKFVIDLRSSEVEPGNDWLRDAALHLPKDRVVVDATSKVLYDQTDVIGYASWGSNAKNRHRRFLWLHWLPGAIMTEHLSSTRRPFFKPPPDCITTDWQSPNLW